MVDVKDELLAPCGLYCGVCRVYIAHKDNDIEFKKEILPIYKAYGAKSVSNFNTSASITFIVKFL